MQAIAKPPNDLQHRLPAHQAAAALLPVVEESRLLERNPKVLACSVSGGYQYADVPWVGPSVVVVTNGDEALAEREARRLSKLLWASRDQLKLGPADAAKP